MYHLKNSTSVLGGGNALCNKRIAGLDIIRSFAILFVIGSHFMIHTDFNSTLYHGVSMFVQGMWQSLTLINVPLFLILTGYLNGNKQVGKKYYKGCVRVLRSYLVISIITIIFRKYYLLDNVSMIHWILKIFDFSAIPYGWYIEMWIGLFFLTPFLNVLWKNIDSKRNKGILILTLYLCSALPDFFNRYGVHLAPGYWSNVAPLCFYFIGCYIKEYQPEVKSVKLWLAILGICLINPIANLVLSYGHRTMLHLIGTGYGIFGIPMAALFFLAFYKRNIRNGFIRKLVERVSVLSLDMYLISYVFDMIVYGWCKSHFAYEPGLWGLLFFAIVPTIFISSFLFAWIKEKIFQFIKIE
jgi:surface polysaccharide O-acyltransferase-like enzyme